MKKVVFHKLTETAIPTGILSYYLKVTNNISISEDGKKVTVTGNLAIIMNMSNALGRNGVHVLAEKVSDAN